MEQIRPYADDRLTGMWVYCQGRPDTRDHVPLRVFTTGHLQHVRTGHGRPRPRQMPPKSVVLERMLIVLSTSSWLGVLLLFTGFAAGLIAKTHRIVACPVGGD